MSAVAFAGEANLPRPRSSSGGSLATLLKVSLFMWVVGCYPVANAASFDCGKASSVVERLICSNDDLSRLDSELADHYSQALTNSKEPLALKQSQREWLAQERNSCADADCIRAACKKRIIELSEAVRSRAGVVRTESGSATMKVKSACPKGGEVLQSELGENWQYARDADKVPTIKKAFTRGDLVPPASGYIPSPICKDFPADFVAGNFEVIEPDLQVFSEDDPRLGASIFEGGGKERNRDDPAVHWHRCDAIPATGAQYENPETYFGGLPGLPPYRFFHIKVGGDMSEPAQDVLVYRERGDGCFSHDYILVDIKTCSTKKVINVHSPMTTTGASGRDALSLVIRYRGQAMVVEYSDFAQVGTGGEMPSIMVVPFMPAGFCMWRDPRLAHR